MAKKKTFIYGEFASDLAHHVPETLLIDDLKAGERLMIGRRDGVCVVITVGEIVPGSISCEIGGVGDRQAMPDGSLAVVNGDRPIAR